MKQAEQSHQEMLLFPAMSGCGQGIIENQISAAQWALQRVVSNWNMGAHEVTLYAQLHWALCPAQSTTFSKYAVRLERMPALSAADEIECGNVTFWGKTKNWKVAKSMKTQVEKPEKECPEQGLHLNSTAEPKHRLGALSSLEKPYGIWAGGSCSADPSFATEANPDNKVSLNIYLSRSEDSHFMKLLPGSEEYLTLSRQQTSLLNLWNGDF